MHTLHRWDAIAYQSEQSQFSDYSLEVKAVVYKTCLEFYVEPKNLIKCWHSLTYGRNCTLTNLAYTSFEFIIYPWM